MQRRHFIQSVKIFRDKYAFLISNMPKEISTSKDSRPVRAASVSGPPRSFSTNKYVYINEMKSKFDINGGKLKLLSTQKNKEFGQGVK